MIYFRGNNKNKTSKKQHGYVVYVMQSFVFMQVVGQGNNRIHIMTRIISTLFLILTYVGSSGQVKFIDIYNAHKFPCSNKIHSTEEETICSDIKLKFADSLLNLLYNKIMKEIDTEIENSQNELLSLKSMQGQIPRNVDEIENLNREINQALFLKNSLTDSQRRWIKLRDSNELINSIIHQGGTGMVTSEIESKLYDTLERIKKLETLF